MSAQHHGRKGRPWRRIRLQVLQRDPICMICHRRPSTTADHIIPLSIRPDLAHDLSNLRGSCGPCNYRGGAALTNGRRGAQRAAQTLNRAHHDPSW